MAEKADSTRSGWHEAWGIMLVAFCVLVVLSMASYHFQDISLLHAPPNDPPRNFIGPVGAWFSFIVFMAFGVAGFLLPVWLGSLGALMLMKGQERVGARALWMLVLWLAAVCLAELQPELWEPVRLKLNIPSPGGALGQLLAGQILIRLLGDVGAAILVAAALIAGVVFLFEVQPAALFAQGKLRAIALWQQSRERMKERQTRREQLDDEEKRLAKQRRRLEQAISRQAAAPQRPATPAAPPPAAAAPVAPPPATVEEEVPPEPAPRGLLKRRKPVPPKEAPAPSSAVGAPSTFVLPTTALLDPLPPAADRVIKGDFTAGSQLLKETLAEFGIDGEVTNVERGPVVTRYEVLPAAGVRVERIASLSNNIALAMKAETVRVQAPIPGKGVVGIEVPNLKTTMVYLREMLESEAWQKEGLALPLCLGKDVGGREIVGDLAEMPHLLIAGATGSGKTVCMNSILAGLLMSRTPEEMRLLLVDPKIVEFSVYNQLPHLVVPVITDAKKVGHGLRWAIDEMEKRYKLFAQVGVRNIRSYNGRPRATQAELFEEQGTEADEERPPDRLPYIIVIVDELADLMLVAQAEVENHIARLAQLSRAVGIHMILATQRPSVNVITGTIKANFPARIAFKVAQKVDSRTILDANGADKLLGKGDMLFLPPGSHKLIRAQGCLTSDNEINGIVAFIKKQGEPQYESDIKEKLDNKRAEIPEMEEDDDLLETAVEIIRQTRRASTSSLQRRLRIGYTRAARLMDLLEERGIVGPPRGSDPREILIDLDGEIPQNAVAETNES